MNENNKNEEIVPSNAGSLLKKVIDSPAFADFGKKPGDKMTLKRKDSKSVEVKKTSNSTVTKASINGEKEYQIIYDNGTDVGGYSKKKKKKKK